MIRSLRRLLSRRRDRARLLDVLVHGYTPTHRVPDAAPEEWT